ncbi:hypothetical protein [Agrobacterium sp. DSM 25558]|uniref:hypothetical protein n=1 Tax=Agrobacterium sp. DSM 25558 TaxID=1907665 RepID=UPI0011784C61|nr:hypothetical protein [Agrobacterium sp. DSM 25558]
MISKPPATNVCGRFCFMPANKGCKTEIYMYRSAHRSINFADTILKTVHFHFSQTETSFSTPAPPLLLPDDERGMIEEHWQTMNADGRFSTARFSLG